MTPPLFHFDHFSLHTEKGALLKDLSMTIHEGDFIALSGSSGSGKSSLLTALLGFFPHTTGMLSFRGKPYTPHLLQDLRQQIAPLFQTLQAFEGTTQEIITTPFHYKANRSLYPSLSAIKEILEELSLSCETLTTPFELLSGGEKQRILLARALLLKRPILFLDEPTAALDAQTQDAVLEAVKKRAHTIISISHNPVWIAAASRHWVIKQHGITEVAQGAPHEHH